MRVVRVPKCAAVFFSPFRSTTCCPRTAGAFCLASQVLPRRGAGALMLERLHARPCLSPFMRAHAIARYRTLSHAIARYRTLSHAIARYRTLSHAIGLVGCTTLLRSLHRCKVSPPPPC